MENYDDIAEIVYYLEDNWIGRQRTTRREHRFALSLWNCHQVVLNSLPKTSNSIEG